MNEDQNVTNDQSADINITNNQSNEQTLDNNNINQPTEQLVEDKKVSFLDTLPINKKKQSTNSMYAEQNNKSYELVSASINDNNILLNLYMF